MRELTPEERAKVARVWEHKAGHLYVSDDPEHEGVWWRAVSVCEGEILEWVDSGGSLCDADSHTLPNNLIPCFWGDAATADGLLRTARAAFREPTLHVAPTDDGFLLCVVRPRTNGERWRYVWDGKEWVRPSSSRNALGCVRFQSEDDALLAAILAAP